MLVNDTTVACTLSHGDFFGEDAISNDGKHKSEDVPSIGSDCS